MEQTKQGTKLLPIIAMDGTEYLVDIERREFRDFNYPQNVVGMHTEQGRHIVNAVLGTEWRAFAVDEPIWGRQQWSEVEGSHDGN